MNSEEFGETFLRNDREGPTKAKMAGKKEAKHKAGPSSHKEKNRKETESPTRAKSIEEEQPQGRQDQRPEEGAQGQWRVDAKDLHEGWETIKEIDKVLGHLEGRLDKVTAVIWQVAVQGKALELNVSEDNENGAGSGESSEELETPALQSSMGEHRIVDIQEPAPGSSKPEEPKNRSHLLAASRKTTEGRMEKYGRH